MLAFVNVVIFNSFFTSPQQFAFTQCKPLNTIFCVNISDVVYDLLSPFMHLYKHERLSKDKPLFTQEAKPTK